MCPAVTPPPAANVAGRAVAQLLNLRVECTGRRGCLQYDRRLTDLRHRRPRVQLLLLSLIRLRPAMLPLSAMPLHACIWCPHQQATAKPSYLLGPVSSAKQTSYASMSGL